MTARTIELGRAAWAGAIAFAAVLAAGSLSFAQAPSPRPDLRFHKYQSNPTLFASARKYFPADEDEGTTKRIFRLTRDQLDQSAAALLPAFVTGVSIKTSMARDPLQTNYEYAELLSFNSANIGALSGWIGGIAERVRKNPAGLINCAASQNAPDCLKAEARKFVVKAFRGDVGEKRIGEIVNFYVAGVQASSFAQATGDLVEVALHSPSFLFRREIEVDAGGRLASAQLLPTLTYTIADAPPEKVGLESAKAEQYLRSTADTRTTIATIADSKAARDKLMRFFVAWLEIREPADFTLSQKIFPEFTPKLAAAMVEETTRFLRAELARPAPSLKDITQSTRAYVSKALEPIYAAKAEDAAGAKPVELDPAQRLGIFSQAAVIASHSGPTDTRTIKRGVFWVRKVMCMDLEPPPQGLDLTLYEAHGGTERQRIEATTKQTACVGCHKIIDPFGFFQESFDALGRWRTTDNGQPVDTSVKFDFLDEGPASTAGPVEALRTLTGSAMFKQCFVRQLFRYYIGRKEDASDDPLLRRLFFEFANNDNQDILRLVQLLASSDLVLRRQ